MTGIEERLQKDSAPSACLGQEDADENQQYFAVSKSCHRSSGSKQKSLVCPQDRDHTDSPIHSSKPLNFYSIPQLIGVAKPGSIKNGSAYRCVSIAKSHEGCVHSIAFAEEYSLLYSGSIGKSMLICHQYNQSGELVECCRFGCEGGAVKSILVAQDKIFSAHQDHRIRVWKRSKTPNTAMHKLVCTIPTVKDYLQKFMSPRNYVEVRRHKKCLWIQHADTVTSLAVENGNLYSASWDRTVKVWRLSDFRCLESFRAHDDAVNALVVSSSGFLYTASADSTIKAWTKYADNKKHSLVAVMDRHNFAVNALALSPDGLILYSGGGDSSVFVWQTHKMTERTNLAAGELRGHRQAVLCMATVSDIVCYGSADKSIRVWKREAGSLHSCVAVLEGHTAPVKCLSSRIDELMNCVTIYSGSLDREVRGWRVLQLEAVN